MGKSKIVNTACMFISRSQMVIAWKWQTSMRQQQQEGISWGWIWSKKKEQEHWWMKISPWVGFNEIHCWCHTQVLSASRKGTSQSHLVEIERLIERNPQATKGCQKVAISGESRLQCGKKHWKQGQLQCVGGVNMDTGNILRYKQGSQDTAYNPN